MQAFLRTLAYGLAALCLLIVSGGLTALVVMKQRGTFDPNALRTMVLSGEEREWLSDYHARAEEPPSVSPRSESEDDLLRRIAELGAADEAQRLVAALRRKKLTLDERQTWLDRQESEVQLARADLERLRSQLDERLSAIERETAEQIANQSEWAAVAAAEARRMEVLQGVELERAKDLAKRFELQKDDAWAGLRPKPPQEIAKYLALMDPKRAARLLTMAGQDREFPDIVQAIHASWLRLDLTAMSGDHIAHLASLYRYMTPEDVAAAVRSAPASESAAIITVMGDPKREAAILIAIRAEDSAREAEIQTLLDKNKAAVQ